MGDQPTGRALVSEAMDADTARWAARLAARLAGAALGFVAAIDGEAIELLATHGAAADPTYWLRPLLRHVAAGAAEPCCPVPAGLAGDAGAVMIALPVLGDGGALRGAVGALGAAAPLADLAVVEDLRGLAALLATELASRRQVARAHVATQAAEAQAAREARLRAAIDSLPQHFWMTDATGRYVEQNAWDRAAFGDLVGRAPHEADPPLELAERWQEKHRRVLAGETLHNASWRRHPDGDGERWVESIMVPLVQDGAIVGLVGHTVDRTVQSVVERRLAESEARLKAALDALPFGFLICDAQGQHVMQNSVHRARWGDAIGKPHAETCQSPEAISPVPDVLSRVLAGETVRRQRQHVCDGRLADIEEIYAPVRTATGIGGFVGLAIDHSERLAAERRLAETEARLRAAIDALPFPFFICDLEGRPVLQNATDRALRGDGIGKTFAELGLPAELVAHFGVAIERIKQGQTVQQQLRYARGGRLSHIEEVYAPVYAAGVVTGFVGLAIDHTDRVLAEQRLQESEARLADYLATASDWAWESDAQHRVVDLTGWPGDGALKADDFIGRTRWALVGADPATDPLWRRHRADLDARRPFRGFVYAYPDAATAAIWIEVNGNPVIDADGAFRGYRGTSREITGRVRAEAALREAHARLEALAGSGLIGITAGRGFVVEEANDAFLRIVGRERQELEAGLLDWRELSADDRTADAVASAGAVRAVEQEFRRPDGSRVPVLLNHVLLEPTQRRWFALVQDLSSMKAAEQRVRQLAERDVLTGLANRHVLFERLKGDLGDRRRPGVLGALLMLDLDHFKEVNDTLGHDAGDALLRAVGERLTAVLRDTDTVARIGGDEFAMILRGLRSPADIAEVAGKLLTILGDTLELGGRKVQPRCSIGISLFPRDGSDALQLLKNADIALYQAKAKGRGTFCFFEPALLQALERRRAIGEALQAAIGGDAFEVELQPQIELASGAHAGFEALARWRRDGTLVPPGEFIAIAEETGLIVPLGRLVLGRALDALSRCDAAGFDAGRIAVNLAAAQLKGPGFAAEVATALALYGIDPGRLEVEVTENVLLDRDAETVAATLRDLHRLGVTIALDDFGTGYASLAHLKRFPVDRLKIDRSFVRDIGRDSDNAVIVRTIINLAHTLGMTVVAEGVETAEQQAFLALHACDLAQGYRFARPLPVAALAAYLAALRPAAREPHGQRTAT